MFETVLDQTYLALGELMTAKLRAVDNPLDRLRAVVETTLTFHRDHPQLIGGLFQLWAVAGRDVSSILDRERRIVVAARDAMVADLRAGLARKEVLPCDPVRIVDLVLAVVDGVLVHHVLGIAHADEVLEELAARVIEPLRPPKRKRRQR